MATRRNQFFRELIYDAMTNLTNYDSDIVVDYSFDARKLPSCFVLVNNENFRYEEDTESYNRIAEGTCKFSVVINHKTTSTKDSDKNLNIDADDWIERVEYLLSQIDLPTEYTQQMGTPLSNVYNVAVTEIRVQGNNREITRQDQYLSIVEIFGEIIFEKQNLID